MAVPLSYRSICGRSAETAPEINPGHCSRFTLIIFDLQNKHRIKQTNRNKVLVTDFFSQSHRWRSTGRAPGGATAPVVVCKRSCRCWRRPGWSVSPACTVCPDVRSPLETKTGRDSVPSCCGYSSSIQRKTWCRNISQRWSGAGGNLDLRHPAC